ncbi:MAG: hypothetical protein MUO85_10470 [candidate division Zixibacteria bacterium]|nr:hypothetical protein [candidate division Zixibacteria bacterium]
MNWYLVIIALILSSILFVVLTLIATLLANWLKLHEDLGLKMILKSLSTSYLFEFFIPFLIFVMLLFFLPFKGFRFGILFACLVFIFNSLQVFLFSSQGITKLGFDFTAYTLFWKLLKYLVSFGIAGWILGII